MSRRELPPLMSVLFLLSHQVSRFSKKKMKMASVWIACLGRALTSMQLASSILTVFAVLNYLQVPGLTCLQHLCCSRHPPAKTPLLQRLSSFPDVPQMFDLYAVCSCCFLLRFLWFSPSFFVVCRGLSLRPGVCPHSEQSHLWPLGLFVLHAVVLCN